MSNKDDLCKCANIDGVNPFECVHLPWCEKIADLQAEANNFWEHKSPRIYVVKLTWRRTKLSPRRQDVKYVRAKTPAGGMTTARLYSIAPSNATASARLAHPEKDLAATHVYHRKESL